MEALSALFIILLVVYPIYYFNELPDVIPVHFNFAGNPDGYSQKSSMWILPGIGVILSILLLVMSRFPHLHNYSLKITEENAERQYRLSSKLMRIVNLIISGGFLYISYRTIQISLNQAGGLGSSFLIIFLSTISGVLIIYVILSYRKHLHV